MICILHGYLLDGSGSNLWTKAIVRSLCRDGHDVHLVCQEPHPERFDFIASAHRYRLDGSVETAFARDVPYAGRCTMHQPEIGDTLPVYVWDRYEQFSHVVPMVDLDDCTIETYIERNRAAVARILERFPIDVIHANHVVLMPTVALRAGAATGTPFVVMPHGSAIEFAVKRDARFMDYAAEALAAADRIVAVAELRERVDRIFSSRVPGIVDKVAVLNLGVDTSLFEPIALAARPAHVGAMLRRLEDVPRGKRAEASAELRGRLAGGMDRSTLEAALAAGRGYDAKRPDEDLEAKLRQVDWAQDDTLLYVGRLISSKGFHSILAALPSILARRPRTRLIAVGHGPQREVMEAFAWALEHGERELATKIARWGAALEGSEPRPLDEVLRFFERLEADGALDAYFDAARRHLRAGNVVFTGYLTHAELRYLFPCCDVAIFPSVVAESGPLVFLEAIASGCFPLGTYFAGMAASIDSVAAALPPSVADLMRLNPDPGATVADIARSTPEALDLGGRYAGALREVAEREYDWRSIARRLAAELRGISQRKDERL